MRVLIIFILIITSTFSIAQVKKTTSKSLTSQSTKAIVKGLPNETLKDLLNSCAISCFNGSQGLNAFAYVKFHLPWGFTEKDAAQQFAIAEYNEWMIDKIFILFYNPYEQAMQSQFFSLGVTPNNARILSKFLIENISKISERDNLYEENQDNNSISYIVNEHIDEFPEFPYNTYSKFLADSMQYPQDALNNHIEGKVIVQFVIDNNGNPKDIEIKEGQDIGYGIPEEAMRLVSLMKWKPGKKDGEFVTIKAKKNNNFSPPNKMINLQLLVLSIKIIKVKQKY